jgi:hypothetical protein
MHILTYYQSSLAFSLWAGFAGTRAQSGDRYGSGTLQSRQVLRGSLPLLSPLTYYTGKTSKTYFPAVNCCTLWPTQTYVSGSQGRSGRVRKISPPPGFDPRNAQPVASRYTDWAIPASCTSMRALLLVNVTHFDQFWYYGILVYCTLL